MRDRDEFYVGYLPKSPKNQGRWTARIVVLLGVSTVVVASVLIAAQHSFAEATFEFGKYRKFSGTLHEMPYPRLELDGRTSAVLVGEGKHGADVRGLDGLRVMLEGSRIYRENDQMIELRQGTLRTISAERVNGQSTTESGVRATLLGEIVDSKCYLGVMNPGEGKVHRDCAARCISGGIPPALIVRDETGARRLVLLAGRGGTPLHREVLDFVAEPIRVTGQLITVGGSIELQIDPAQIHRISE